MAFDPNFNGSNFNGRGFGQAGAQAGVGSYDAGLRAYMCRVFNWMALGLLLTAAVAYGVAETSLRALFFHMAELPSGAIVLRPTLLGGLAIFAPLAFVLVLSFGINRLSRPAVQTIFLLYSATMGASMASLLLSFTGVSVARTFLITALMFGGTALWGYTTGANLLRFGSFLFMGLIGIMLAMVVNIFLHSAPLEILVSLIGVALFTALAAYDTQRIKITYQQALAYAGPEDVSKLSVYDALTMYLDFVNLFQFLLQFTGSRSKGNS